jgi:hypothetical protein
MWADGGRGADAAVVADERRAFDRVQVVDVDPFPDPDVPAQPHARDVEPDELVERVEVRLPELVQVADVLPVAVHREPVDRAAHLE